MLDGARSGGEGSFAADEAAAAPAAAGRGKAKTPASSDLDDEIPF